jgi:hypothetical protein
MLSDVARTSTRNRQEIEHLSATALNKVAATACQAANTTVSNSLELNSKHTTTTPHAFIQMNNAACCVTTANSCTRCMVASNTTASV